MRRVHVIVATCVGLVLLSAVLLFPAIMRAREAAARVSCHGNFKQLALALHCYADTNPFVFEGRRFEAFPPGTFPHATLPSEQRLSWIIATLPYIEQDSVYKQFDLTRGPGDPVNAPPAAARFQHLVCRSSGEYRSHDRGGVWKSATPLTHIVGVAGVGPDAAALPFGHPRAGVFGSDRRTGLGEFVDRTGNTLLIIEVSHEVGHWAFGGPGTLRAIDPAAHPQIGEGRAFGGWHPRVCSVAFADGSVRSLNNDIAPTILEALATVAGKEALPADW
jgi:Protein of unknown function (DUF1559)